MRSAEIRYTYDEAFARIASTRFLMRYARSLFLVAALLALVGVLFVVEESYAAALITFAVVVATFIALARYRRRATRLARSLGPLEIEVSVDDEGISFRMKGTQSRSEWSRHRAVWRFDDVWLLFPYGTSSAYTGMPTAAMSPEFQQILLENLSKHGGKVG